MSQHNMIIANQNFPSFRADLNSALAALASLSSGAAAPTNPTQYQLWLDTSSTHLALKIFDGADWIGLSAIDPGTNTAVPVLANDALSGDTLHGGIISDFASTGIDDNTTENILSLSDSETVINDSGNNHNTRIEGDTDTNLLFAHASSDSVGIGTGTPTEKLEINGRVKAQAFTTCSLTLNDDTAASIDLGGEAAGWCFIASSNLETARGSVMFKVGASPFIDAENAVGLPGTTTTGLLSGATGADGDFTVSAHTDNRLYFENRTGSTLTCAVTLIAPTTA